MSKPRLNRAERLLLLTPLLLIVVPTLRSISGVGDRLDKAQQKLAGEHAINCGVGHIKTLENNRVSENRAQVDACSVAAFEAGKPFLARYDIDNNPPQRRKTGQDNYSFGVVRTPQGQVYFFYYTPLRAWWSEEYDYKEALCPAPEIITHLSLRNERWQTVGCGTCSNEGSEDTANCILHP